MNPQTYDQTLRWCAVREIAPAEGTAARLAFANRDPSAFVLPVPASGRRQLALGYVLLTTPSDDEEHFSGGLLLINEWDIGSESFERVGWRVLEGLRGTGPSRLAETPGQLFGPSDFVAAQSFLAQPLLFQWDAHYVPEAGQFLAYFSHHAQLTIVPKTREIGEKLFARFESGGWEPREEPPPSHWA